MTIRKKITDNPIISLLLSVAGVVAAWITIHQGVQLADSLVTTEAEASEIHLAYDQKLVDVGKKIDDESTRSECRWLSDKMERLQYEIYVLERDEASPDLAQAKRQQFAKHDRRYRALKCASQLGSAIAIKSAPADERDYRDYLVQG